MSNHSEANERGYAPIINVRGNYIQEQNITVHGDLYFSEPSKSQADADEEDIDDESLIEELMPIFYNEMAEVEKFLKRIKGAKAVSVVAVVNQLLRERKVSGESCQMPLWEVLSKHGLYDKKYGNWSKQIRK